MSVDVDILVKDCGGRDLVLAEVRPSVLSPDIVEEYFTMLEEAAPPVPFAMVIDPLTIRLKRFGRNGTNPARIELSTLDVLRHYDPDLPAPGEARTPPWYRESLVRSWFEDLGSGATGATPPGTTELAQVGLLDRLQDAQILREVTLETDPVR